MQHETLWKTLVVVHLPYSRKYWRSIKFGGLAVGEATVKFKSVKCKCDLRDIRVILRVRVRAYYTCTELPPNLNPPIFLFRLLGIKPPNLKIANISGYTVCKNFGVKTSSKLHIPSENIMGGYLFTCGSPVGFCFYFYMGSIISYTRLVVHVSR